MGIATGFTAERMLEIEASSIVSAEVRAGHLIMIRHDGDEIDAGPVGSGGGGGGGGADVVIMSSPELLADTWSSDIVHFLGTDSPDVTIWDEATDQLTDLDIRVTGSNSFQLKSGKYNPVGTYRIRVTGVTSSGGGGGGLEYEKTFSTPALHWDFPHNFGTKALSVYTESVSGYELKGDVSYLDDNTVRVTFYYEQTGFGRVFN